MICSNTFAFACAFCLCTRTSFADIYISKCYQACFKGVNTHSHKAYSTQRDFRVNLNKLIYLFGIFLQCRQSNWNSTNLNLKSLLYVNFGSLTLIRNFKVRIDWFIWLKYFFGHFFSLSTWKPPMNLNLNKCELKISFTIPWLCLHAAWIVCKRTQVLTHLTGQT